jgi:uncharacterized LabA/DUF88 family protein
MSIKGGLMAKEVVRVAVFMDGNYFVKVNNYYRFEHARRQNMSFAGLMEFVRGRVSAHEGLDRAYCQVVEAHWFRGRFSTNQMDQKYPEDGRLLKQMKVDRTLDDLLMYQGIVQHVLPMQVAPQTNQSSEKGIDVWLALEAFELAILKRYDVLVLLAGDGDYVPLVRKVNGLGTRVMVLGWEIDAARPPIKTSQSLLDEASYPVIMNSVIDDKSNKHDGEVQGIFPKRI